MRRIIMLSCGAVALSLLCSSSALADSTVIRPDEARRVAVTKGLAKAMPVKKVLGALGGRGGYLFRGVRKGVAYTATYGLHKVGPKGTMVLRKRPGRTKIISTKTGTLAVVGSEDDSIDWIAKALPSQVRVVRVFAQTPAQRANAEALAGMTAKKLSALGIREGDHLITITVAPTSSKARAATRVSSLVVALRASK